MDYGMTQKYQANRSKETSSSKRCFDSLIPLAESWREILWAYGHGPYLLALFSSLVFLSMPVLDLFAGSPFMGFRRYLSILWLFFFIHFLFSSISMGTAISVGLLRDLYHRKQRWSYWEAAKRIIPHAAILGGSAGGFAALLLIVLHFIDYSDE